jgi:hydroxymethylbilane synthase
VTRAIRLGTRGSTLARRQSALVAGALESAGVAVELVVIVTAGDVRQPDAAWGEGAFVGALETALRAGSIDLAVHSAKDVPIEPELDLVIAAYPIRADPRDALVSRTATALTALPAGAVVGTDSPRRTGFVRAMRPDLRVVPLHGNVDSRLRRLDEGEVDAVVLAVAGLERLGRADRITDVLPPDLVPPAPGQGALAVQVRRADDRVAELVAAIDDLATRRAVTAERELLRATGGGCRSPIGALATVAGDRLTILAGAVDPSGRGRVFLTGAGPLATALQLAQSLGHRLVEQATAEASAVESAVQSARDGPPAAGSAATR